MNSCTAASSFSRLNVIGQYRVENCGAFTYWLPIIVVCLKANDEGLQIVRPEGGIDLADNDRVDKPEVLFNVLAQGFRNNTVLHTSKQDMLGRNFLGVDVREISFTKLYVTTAPFFTWM